MARCLPFQQEDFIRQMTDQMTQLAQRMAEWVAAQPRTLEEMEKESLALLRQLEQAFLTSLLTRNPPSPARVVRLPTISENGQLEVNRPYYLCPSCHHRTVPLAQKLGLCAGRITPWPWQVFSSPSRKRLIWSIS